jgi:hypothetical protein
MTPAAIAIGYFGSCLAFSGAYWAAWAYNPDCFIVHQEMNMRPAAAWRAAVRRRGKPAPNTPTLSGSTLDEQCGQYSSLANVEGELQQQIELLTPRLEFLASEVQRLGALHNRATSKRMNEIVARDAVAYRAALDAILVDLRQQLAASPVSVEDAAATAKAALQNVVAPQSELEAVMSEATKTEYLERFSAVYDEQTQTSGKVLDLKDQLHKNRVAQRELMEGWEEQRKARLLYFDFLYFSFGVGTSNTFGDLIPNARGVRYVIVGQLLVSLVLVGLFLNSLSGPK